MTFDDIAGKRLLSSAKGRLGEFQWNVEPDPYQRRTLPSSAPLETLLAAMARRALEPILVTQLFNAFPDRPFERALLAWDVACGALLGRDDAALTQQIHAEIAPLKHLGPIAKVAIPRDRVQALIAAVTSSKKTSVLLDDFETVPSLAALVALKTMRKNLDGDPEIVELVVAHAKRLSLAHLPSLALAFMQILWDGFAVPQALDLMIEMALDHGMLEVLPEMHGQDDHAMQQQTYLLLRSSLRDYDIITAKKLLEGLDKHPAIHNSPNPFLLLARGELLLLDSKRLDEPSRKAIDAIGAPTSGWRYAIFVRDATEIRFGYATPSLLVDRYISMFGNDARIWGHAAFREESRPQLLTLLARELRYASHDPEVWRAASIIVGDGEPIGAELEQRLSSQLTSAFE